MARQHRGLPALVLLYETSSELAEETSRLARSDRWESRGQPRPLRWLRTPGWVCWTSQSTNSAHVDMSLNTPDTGGAEGKGGGGGGGGWEGASHPEALTKGVSTSS